jgi:hypothetical protein
VAKWQKQVNKTDKEIIEIFLACEKSVENTEQILASP